MKGAIKMLEEASEEKKAFDYALRLLALRDYSVHKMKMKLKQRKFSAEDIDKAVERLQSYNYLREEEYTRIRIKQLLMKGYANSYIINKLTQEKLNISSEAIENMRKEQGFLAYDQIKYLIEKKLRGREIPYEFELKMKLKNKIMRFLISKGYHFDEINSALKSYF